MSSHVARATGTASSGPDGTSTPALVVVNLVRLRDRTKAVEGKHASLKDSVDSLTRRVEEMLDLPMKIQKAEQVVKSVDSEVERLGQMLSSVMSRVDAVKKESASGNAVGAMRKSLENLVMRIDKVENNRTTETGEVQELKQSIGQLRKDSYMHGKIAEDVEDLNAKLQSLNDNVHENYRKQDETMQQIQENLSICMEAKIIRNDEQVQHNNGRVRLGNNTQGTSKYSGVTDIEHPTEGLLYRRTSHDPSPPGFHVTNSQQGFEDHDLYRPKASIGGTNNLPDLAYDGRASLQSTRESSASREATRTPSMPALDTRQVRIQPFEKPRAVRDAATTSRHPAGSNSQHSQTRYAQGPEYEFTATESQFESQLETRFTDPQSTDIPDAPDITRSPSSTLSSLSVRSSSRLSTCPTRTPSLPSPHYQAEPSPSPSQTALPKNSTLDDYPVGTRPRHRKASLLPDHGRKIDTRSPEMLGPAPNAMTQALIFGRSPVPLSPHPMARSPRRSTAKGFVDLKLHKSTHRYSNSHNSMASQRRSQPRKFDPPSAEPSMFNNPKPPVESFVPRGIPGNPQSPTTRPVSGKKQDSYRATAVEPILRGEKQKTRHQPPRAATKMASNSQPSRKRVAPVMNEDDETTEDEMGAERKRLGFVGAIAGSSAGARSIKPTVKKAKR